MAMPRLVKIFSTMTTTRLILAVALFVAVFANGAFFSKVAQAYPLAEHGNLLFVASLLPVLAAVFTILLSLVCHGRLVRPLLAMFLIVSAAIAYFGDSFGVIVDQTMIENVIETDTREAGDLLSGTLGLYLLFLGVLPAVLVYVPKLERRGLRGEFASRIKLVAASIAIVIAAALPLSGHYASFLRVHKELRAHVNPVQALYSAGRLIENRFASEPVAYAKVGTDAQVPNADVEKELVIMVVGETARADHFSLNGYGRDTNPMLAKEKVVNFPDVRSCGTSTAISVPCMFSRLDRESFDVNQAGAQDNALDILKRTNVSILWRDNNSSSKGVADRVAYEGFLTAATNPVCDPECRDVGMLDGLDEFIEKHSDGDILIVLHQMGNHGPAYYKRYPKAFEKFTPVCKSADFAECTDEEIVNAYDNAILYTDYFLSRVIGLLKRYDDRFETAMVYASDHGESLGELGLYLHGLPYMLAPEAQKHVPMVMWFGKNFDRHTLAGLEEKRKKRFSHDNLFSTLLGLFEVQSDVYDPAMDILDHSGDRHHWVMHR